MSATTTSIGPRTGGSGLAGIGSVAQVIPRSDVQATVRAGLTALPFDGRRVLAIVPDLTRTMPMPMMREILAEELGPRVAALDFLVALGTHQPLSEAQLGRLLGAPVVDGRLGPHRVFNHRWDLPASFVTLGRIPASEIRALSGGLLDREVTVSLNRLILDYDRLLVCGPVFPHEVAGFSGGNKYLVPGIAGPEIIDLTHWLGALMTNYHVIGTSDTPVRAVIDRAASLVDRPIDCVAVVVAHDGLHGVYVGGSRTAWRAAADLSARLHVTWVDRPFQRVLSIMPEMYDDLWTAAKGMYKLEPAVADGGEVVIYAPHITEVSYTHGRLLDEIGYHCRDYFVGQWARFDRYPGGVLAHSTHLKGLGRYDAATGVETPRIRVTLATGIPEERCRRINLGYLAPSSIRLDEWRNREDEGVLVVPRAGETLYRLVPRGAGLQERRHDV